MIFKLFKSKNSWQHKDSNVRISAINDELDSDNNEDKAILLSLLEGDPSELVRRAVLLKFNCFDHYLTAVSENDHSAVQAFAAAQIRDILADKHTISLSTAQKQAFINTTIQRDSFDTALFSYWLEHEQEPSIIVSLVEALLPKKNTAQFLLQTFSKKQSPAVQTLLLSLALPELSDQAFLAKLVKKAGSDDIVKLINDRLAQQRAQLEKPKKLLKQNQLILAKLLALKDQSDYGHYITKKASLAQEWQHNRADIDCLSEEDQQTLETKYDKITAQLTELFAPKEEAFQQAQIAEQLLQDKREARAQLTDSIAVLNQEIITAVFEESDHTDESLVQQAFAEKLKQLNQQLGNSVLNESDQAEFAKQIAQLEKRLTQLPEIAQSVSEATYLVSKISQLSLPQTLAELCDRQQIYHDWLSQWKLVDKKACGILPQSIVDAHLEITKLWRAGLKPLEAEQRQLFNQSKKKLIDLKRLLAAGKYKVCFGIFKGVKQAMQLLSKSQQLQLQHDYSIVSEKIAEISDWEHYIATPRKQELLAEINAIVTNPLDNPNEQADKVKHYRKIWNSLGHADEEIDQALNEQFNLACEQAFAPCRQYYAEQEKRREQHLAKRHELLKQAEQLAQMVTSSNDTAEVIDFKALDGKLNKLQQRWQQAGEVDREHYQKLLKQYKHLIQPIRKAIKDFHDANGASKQALIKQAEQQLAVEDIYQAIDTIKQLQQQWRDVGFAGSHQESKLWQNFRAINDQVFAKREQVKSKQQAQLDELANSYNDALAQLKVEAENTGNDQTRLKQLENEASDLFDQVRAIRPVPKSSAIAIERFIAELADKIALIEHKKSKVSWQSLFALLNKISNNSDGYTIETLSDETEFQQLSSFWKKRLAEQCQLTTIADCDIRAEKTLALEILAKVDSPAELADQRMAVQVGLIQTQMQSSVEVDLTQSFVDWLRLGKLQASDSVLLARLQNIFVC
ncbi:hypothetical protein NBRC116592_30660 [Colwellia sp. KU-HH00111]|uniref:DUF349 domain-containing protein n=1 Tax=Colwellia sp. KU-HH00111 TaxID=3127652 RepID=UPI00310AFD79